MKQESGLTGVILAAGKGMRAYPATKYKPKALLEIAGKPLIERIIRIMQDQLNIKHIIIVIGYLGDQIVDHFNRNPVDIQLTFVEQKEQKGIGDALLTVENHVGDSKFLVMLGDELYIDSDHSQLLEFEKKDADAVLLFKEEANKARISKNYTGEIKEKRVFSLVEKPEEPATNLMGVGTYLLNKKVFTYIKNTLPSKLRNEVEITDVLSSMAKQENVYASFFKGTYVNVNYTDDINLANYMIREKNFNRYKVSVVIPAYNEQETIAGVVEDFTAHDAVDEVLVVNNNSKDNTHQIAEKAGARVVLEKGQGYGCALKRGLDDAKGDIIIITEADGSFSSKDISKFLEYAKDCDMVIGTRTTRQMIEQGANMGSLVRWVNVLYGKIVEALWWSQEPRFTDVGCTYRTIWKTSYKKIRPFLSATGPAFAPEMMIAVLMCRQRIIEIPITYRKRMGGESKHSGYFFALAKTALKMTAIILKKRFMPVNNDGIANNINNG